MHASRHPSPSQIRCSGPPSLTAPGSLRCLLVSPAPTWQFGSQACTMRLLPGQAVSELVGECEAVMTVAPNPHISVILVLPLGPNPSVLPLQLYGHRCTDRKCRMQPGITCPSALGRAVGLEGQPLREAALQTTGCRVQSRPPYIWRVAAAILQTMANSTDQGHRPRHQEHRAELDQDLRGSKH